jgi:hypothetical protein
MTTTTLSRDDILKKIINKIIDLNDNKLNELYSCVVDIIDEMSTIKIVDKYLQFLNECTESADKHISNITIYQTFIMWFKLKHPGDVIPNNRTFVANVKKHKRMEKGVWIDGKSVPGIKYLKIIDDFAINYVNNDDIDDDITENDNDTTTDDMVIDNNEKTRTRKKNKFTNCKGVDGICPYNLKGINSLDYYCQYCFCYMFPSDIRVKDIKIKSKESEVICHVCRNHPGDWYHNIPIYINYDDGCCPTKRRIDLYILVGNTMLCVEVDQNQHKYYPKYDDFVRYNELLCDFTGKFIFIRYNPDKYKHKNKVIDTDSKIRLEILSNEINKQMQRINNDENQDLLEIIHLYYDDTYRGSTCIRDPIKKTCNIINVVGKINKHKTNKIEKIVRVIRKDITNNIVSL